MTGEWRLPPMPIPDEAREHIRGFLNQWPISETFGPGAPSAVYRDGCVDCGAPLVDDHRCPDCDPCPCGGRRWIEDEGWTGRYEYGLPGREPVPGDGMIPCGFCSDWDIEPMAPYTDRVLS